MALPNRMSNYRVGFFVALSLCAILALSATALAAGVSSAHVNPARPDACEGCHSLQRGAMAPAPVSGNDKCYACHTSPSGKVFPRAAFELSAHGRSFSPKSRTSAVWPGRKGSDKGLCVNCHDPHGTNARALLRAGSISDSSKLCLTCHSDASAYGAFPGPTVYGQSAHGNPVIGAQLSKSGYAAGECLNCHDPHGSSTGKMTRQATPQLCYGCHADIQSRTEFAMPSGHGVRNPAAKINCSTCHNPHSVRAGTSMVTLPKPLAGSGFNYSYPANAPMLPDQNGNDFCLGCHNPEGARFYGALDVSSELRGAMVTGFRKDLSTSLHAFHVNQRRLGCANCHDAHASENRKLLYNWIQGSQPYAKESCSTAGGPLGTCH